MRSAFPVLNLQHDIPFGVFRFSFKFGHTGDRFLFNLDNQIPVFKSGKAGGTIRLDRCNQNAAIVLIAELFSQLARRGYSIGEVPIYYRRRAGPTKLRPLRDGIKIGWALVTKRFVRLNR